MLPNGRRVGAHLPLGHGMVRAADRAAAIGASAIQVFSDNPTAWHRRPTLPRELAAFRDRLASHGVTPLVIHAPYLVNLAGPDPTFFERSIDVLANELRVATAYGAPFVNVHVGSHRGEGVEAGAARVAEGLRQVQERLDGAAGDAREVGAADAVMLVLENGSGGGFGLGSTVEELVLVDQAMSAAGVDRARIGFCLDTAHLWGAGYSIDDPAGVDEVLRVFDAALGLERLPLIHLNDSRSERGSRLDRHEHLGAGRIGAAGLRRFLDHPGLGHVTYILETPGMDDGWDAVNMRRVLDLAAGRPLGTMPPEAFATGSSKGRSAPAEEDAGR
jgi:deoxyribonuclease IV